MYALKREGRYKRGLLGGHCTKMTKEAKKKIKKKKNWKKMEMSGLTTYRHTDPPSTGASEGGAIFTLRLRLALRPRSILATSRFDLDPCSPFSVSPFAVLRPLRPNTLPSPSPAGPYCMQLRGKRFRYRNPTNLPVTTRPRGRRSPFRPRSCVLVFCSRSHCS